MRKIIAIFAIIFMMFTLTGEEKTLLDIGALTGATFGDSNSAPESWEVGYTGGAKTFEAKNNSIIKEINGKLTVLGYTGTRNETAIYLIPPYDMELNAKDTGAGSIGNVGDIKSITITLYGYGYDNTVYLYLNHNGNELKVPFKTGRFKGEKTFTWENSSYIEDVRYRDLNPKPTYPFAESSLYIEKIEVHNNANDYGLDVLGVGNITVVHDKATLEDEPVEDIFGLDNTRKAKKEARETERLNERNRLLAEEKAKVEDTETTTSVEVSEK